LPKKVVIKSKQAAKRKSKTLRSSAAFATQDKVQSNTVTGQAPLEMSVINETPCENAVVFSDDDSNISNLDEEDEGLGIVKA
jgi:hypothetical protein